MKRTRWILAVLLCAVVIGAALLWGAHRSLSLSKGTCLIAEDGTCLLLLDNSPTILANRTKREDAFADLKTGDSLLVLHDGIQETYPARTGAYAVYKLSGGGTVPQQVIDDLSALGWTICGAEPTTVVLSGGVLTDAAVSWANYSDSPALWAAAMNREKLYDDSVRHLPILKFETQAELEAFQKDFSPVFNLNAGYDEVPSFASVTSHMDDAYFERYTLLLTYVSAVSCSYRYGINSIDLSGSNLCLHAQQTNDPGIGDCAMAGWFLTAALPKEQLLGVTAYDADLNIPRN